MFYRNNRNSYVKGFVAAFGLMMISASPSVDAQPDDVSMPSTQTAAQSGPKLPTMTNPAATAHRVESYGKLPLSFEINQGQTDHRVKFLSRGAGYTLFLTGNEAVLAFHSSESKSKQARPRARFTAKQIGSSPSRGTKAETRTRAVLRMKLAGTDAAAKVTGLDELPGKSNYFIGNDPKKWRTNVPTYTKVRYEGIYPGVDLLYYGNQQQLEYDFVVAPGADPKAIRLSLRGADKARMDAQGDLVLSTKGSEFRFQKPVMYQPTADNRQRAPVEGHYVLRTRNEVGFEVASYDGTRPLVIDPVLAYSTYLGGTNQEIGVGIGVDSSGSAYAFGYTVSADFPVTSGTYQTTCKPNSFNGQCSGDAFITRFSPAGDSLVSSTYLGGSASDVANTSGGIALDSTGNAYVTGFTDSIDFPVTAGAFQPSCTLLPQDNSVCVTTSFVSKLSSDGSQLLYSTYLGGSLESRSAGIGVDSSGNAYVTGVTADLDFPTTASGYQTTCPDPNPNTQYGCVPSAFISQFNPNASGRESLVYSSYFQWPTGQSAGYGIAVDATGHPYVTGTGGVPTTSGAFEPRVLDCINNPPCPVAFAAKFDTTQSGAASLLYSTGLCSANPAGVAVDSSGNAYITGQTVGFDFGYPVGGCLAANGFQMAVNGPADAFLIKLAPTGSSVLYATYLGGSNPSNGDAGWGVAVGSSGDAYVAGQTSSIDFPLKNPIVAAFAGSGSDVIATGFVTKIDPSQTGPASLIYSTYLGGTDFSSSVAQDIAVDSGGNAYVTGFTQSVDFPTASPVEPNLKSPEMAFVVKVGAADAPGLAFGPGALTFAEQSVGTSSTKTVTLTAAGSQSLSLNSIAIAGANPGDFAETDTCGPLPAQLAGGSNCVISVTFTPTAAGPRSVSITVTDSAAGSPHVATLAGTGAGGAPAVSLSPTSVAFGNQAVTTTSGTKPVTLTNSGTTALTISSIAASGDFAQTNNCPLSPNTLAAGATCAISVTFAPAVTGNRAGAITITDDASGSPQSVTLSGNGTDFSVSATPSGQTVKGKSAKYALSVAPISGFTGTVALSCSGAPPQGSCTVSPTSVTLNGTSSSTATVTATTAPGKKGTPRGTYTLTLTGALGTLSHITQVTLTVQ